MTAYRQDLRMVSGDTKTIAVDVWESEDKDAAANLTNSDLKWLLVLDGDVKVEKDNYDVGGIQVDPTDDQRALISLSTSDTENLEGRYEHELQEKVNNDNLTLTKGTAKIVRNQI